MRWTLKSQMCWKVVIAEEILAEWDVITKASRIPQANDGNHFRSFQSYHTELCQSAVTFASYTCYYVRRLEYAPRFLLLATGFSQMALNSLWLSHRGLNLQAGRVTPSRGSYAVLPRKPPLHHSSYLILSNLPGPVQALLLRPSPWPLLPTPISPPFPSSVNHSKHLLLISSPNIRGYPNIFFLLS